MQPLAPHDISNQANPGNKMKISLRGRRVHINLDQIVP
jgi:hypothetical protein